MQDGVVVTQGAGESRIPGRRFLLTRETRERPANGGGKGCRGDVEGMQQQCTPTGPANTAISRI